MIFVSHGIGIHLPGYPAVVVIIAEQFIVLFKVLLINGYTFFYEYLSWPFSVMATYSDLASSFVDQSETISGVSSAHVHNRS